MDLWFECLEEKYQPSSLSGVRFGSRVINFWVKIMERSNFCMEWSNFCIDRNNFCMEQSGFDYAHLQFYSNTVTFFATKFVIGFHALEWISFMEPRQVGSIVLLANIENT